MKLFIDIGHPAHVHYFKNFAQSLLDNGDEIFFTVRDKESTLELINDLDFNYSAKGRGGGNVITKLLKLPFTNFKVLREAIKFKPDLFLSFASPYAAHISKILRKPHISFDDTEHAVWSHFLYRPFSDVILSPSCYLGEKVKKQILFESYMELCYLHPNYFSANESILNKLGVKKEEKFTVLRFVAWNANHDIGQKGFTVNDKIKIVEELSEYCKVFISSEGELPDELKQFALKIKPSQFHDVLSYAKLYIGEGSTTATECAVLGTPAIYANSLKVGNCTELEERYGLVYNLKETDEVLKKATEILNDPDTSSKYALRRKKMLSEKIDPTQFIIWFVENWPESKNVMLENPNYQENFK